VVIQHYLGDASIIKLTLPLKILSYASNPSPMVDLRDSCSDLYNFLIPLPIFTTHDANLIFCQPIWKMYLILDSDLSKVQLTYSPTDFHQTSHQPYPLPSDYENIPDFRFRHVQTGLNRLVYYMHPLQGLLESGKKIACSVGFWAT